jgi:hypothetical protein
LLYDARKGKVREIDSDFSPAVSKIQRHQCEVALRSVEGFDPSGNVIVKVFDVYDEEGTTRPCVGADSRWLFNPETEKFIPAAQDK